MWKVVFYDGNRAVIITDKGTTINRVVEYPEHLEELMLAAFESGHNIEFIREADYPKVKTSSLYGEHKEENHA